MNDVKRYHPHHPDLEGRDVILAHEYDAITAKRAYAESMCDQWIGMHSKMEAECSALRDELVQLRVEVSNEFRMQILHMRREVVRQDRSPLNVRQRMAERLTTLLNRWAKGPANKPISKAQETTTA